MEELKEKLKDKKEIVLKGQWFVKLYGPDGTLKDEREGPNVVCTNGKEFLASFLYSAALAAATNTMKYIAVGSGIVGEAAGDTALGDETARHTGTVSYISGGIFRVIATFATNSAVGSISEYGVLDSNTAGTMLNRDTEATINVGAADVLTVYCDLTIS